MSDPPHTFIEYIKDEERLSDIESGFYTEEWAAVSENIFCWHLLQRLKYGVIFEYMKPIAILLERLVDEKGAVDIIDFGGGCGQLLGDILGLTDFEKWGSITYRIVDSEQSRLVFENLRKRQFISALDKNDGQTAKLHNPLYYTKSSFIVDFSFDGKNSCDVLICNSTSNYIADQAGFLENVANMDFGYFVLSRTLFSDSAPFAGIEKVPYVEGGKCAIWFLNRDQVIKEFLQKGHSLYHQSEPENLPSLTYPPNWPPEYRNVTDNHLIFASKRVSAS
jgi:putative methyltransferase (TIGR04325 family)